MLRERSMGNHCFCMSLLYRKAREIAKIWKKKNIHYSLLKVTSKSTNQLFMFKYLILLTSLLLITSCSDATPPSNSTSGEVKATMIDAPTYGSGNHTIEYFADFQCPACIRFSHTFLPILEEFAASGKLIMVYKQFPLTGPHKNAYRDSIAALCSAEQGQYLPYKKALIALEESKFPTK